MIEKPHDRRHIVTEPAKVIDLLARANRLLSEAQPYIKMVGLRHALTDVTHKVWDLHVALAHATKKVRQAEARQTNQFNRDNFFDEAEDSSSPSLLQDPEGGGDFQ